MHRILVYFFLVCSVCGYAKFVAVIGYINTDMASCCKGEITDDKDMYGSDVDSFFLYGSFL